MKINDTQAIDLRLTVLGAALAALARSLPAGSAAVALESLQKQAPEVVGNMPLSESDEDPILGDLARILEALQRPVT